MKARCWRQQLRLLQGAQAMWTATQTGLDGAPSWQESAKGCEIEQASETGRETPSAHGRAATASATLGDEGEERAKREKYGGRRQATRKWPTQGQRPDQTQSAQRSKTTKAATSFTGLWSA